MEDAHFGGGILKKTGPDGAKSHKDLIEQLIAESKKRKAEKQKIREQTIELTEKLDSEWKDLLPIISKSKRTENNEKDSKNVDSYDKFMRELRFEATGNPTDRLKSEEEIAKEEKEKLEKLEHDRINRMKGFVEEEPKIKHRSADDLDDNFAYESDEEVTLAYDNEGHPLVDLNMLKTEKEEAKKEINSENKKQSDDENIDNDSDDNDSESDSNDDLEDFKQSESETSEDEIKTKKITKKEKINKKSENRVTDVKNIELIEIKRKSITEEILDTIPKNELKEQSETDEEKLTIDTTDSSNNSESESKNSELDIKKTLNTETNKRKLDKNDVTCLKKTKVTENITTPTVNIQKNSVSAENLQKNVVDKTVDAESNVKEIKEENKLLLEEQVVKNKLREEAAKELPYTFTIPTSYEEFQTLFSDKNPEQQSVILERMIKCNHPNLANDNKQLLGKLFVYLLQHLNDISTEPNCFSILTSLLPQMFDLAQLNKEATQEYLIEVIKEKYQEYNKKPKKYPGVEVLLFLKVISSLFPTSDFRHQVCTPTVVFVNQMLTYVRPKNKFEISYGLFLVTLVLEVSFFLNVFGYLISQ